MSTASEYLCCLQQRVKVLTRLRRYCIPASLLPGNQQLLVGSENGKLVIFDIQTRSIAHEVEAHGGKLPTISLVVCAAETSRHRRGDCGGVPPDIASSRLCLSRKGKQICLLGYHIDSWEVYTGPHSEDMATERLRTQNCDESLICCRLDVLALEPLARPGRCLPLPW